MPAAKVAWHLLGELDERVEMVRQAAAIPYFAGARRFEFFLV